MIHQNVYMFKSFGRNILSGIMVQFAAMSSIWGYNENEREKKRDCVRECQRDE